MVWNPTPRRQTVALRLPLYYTGLTTNAVVTQGIGSVPVRRIGGGDHDHDTQLNQSTAMAVGPPKRYTLARDYSIVADLDLPPMSIGWLLIK
jgi:hypothetical protein